jgi:hypothetical protein
MLARARSCALWWHAPSRITPVSLPASVAFAGTSGDAK